MAFVYFCIYETKGLSLEQVDELYAKVDSARHSKGFVPTVQFTEVAELGQNEARRATLADLENEAGRRKSSAGVHTERLDEKY
jgi:MFS transporter, SP family, sugar:H+ symporter